VLLLVRFSIIFICFILLSEIIYSYVYMIYSIYIHMIKGCIQLFIYLLVIKFFYHEVKQLGSTEAYNLKIMNLNFVSTSFYFYI